MRKDKYDDFEQEVKDIENFIGTDVEINPAYYIHNAIIKAQQALQDQDIKTAIFKFRFFTENIEILSKAADMIPDKYEENIKNFEKSKEYKEEKDQKVRHFKLANYKMQLLLGQAFSAKVSTNPMKA